VAAHAALNGPRIKAYKYAGPDFEEGPHSTLSEEEFFDALEMAFKSEEDREGGGGGEYDSSKKVTAAEGRVKEASSEENPKTPTTKPEDEGTTEQQAAGSVTSSLSTVDGSVPQASCPEEIQHRSITGVTHRLTPLMSEKISQYARYLFEEVDNNWSVVYEDGEMKVYRREMEDGGVVVDPLKSFYTATGVSAREIANYFFEYDTRLEWENTVESATILEALSEDTVVFHHLHKRVWPSTQRETVFCSHICTLPNAPREENQIGHTWMVGNFSIDHPAAPTNSKLIRATFQCGMVCQTVANGPVTQGTESLLTRNDINCKILYATNVNPGGWAPPAVVRTIGKREITKFLKKFSGMAQKKTSVNPLSL
jgi:collagen type IV alpha-3-binding protein